MVTGGSRGIGRGIALELGTAGYTVYVLGRSSRSASSSPPSDQRPVAKGSDLTVESAADEITKRGGKGYAMVCDLSKDGVVEEAIERIWKEQQRLDLLVCSAYTTPASTVCEVNSGTKEWICGMPSMVSDCDKFTPPVELGRLT